MKAPLKRKSPGSDVPAAKKAKVEEEESQAQTQSTVQTQTQTQPLTQGSTAEPPADDSVTEPESEESITEPESDPQTESETEPESDAELPQMHFHPRPSNIERKPDQPLLGPLVLDEGGVPGRRKKTQVPGSINTYLRDYQRDGIRFFWERYKDGYGGLLGDDMGLVRYHSF
ncbi:hypothetical protein BC629DRAFT_1072812 [Irpex lacteus]|nr:hypothetical protein BC629DRAFT_1072812 [Irpex lacteus]